MARVEITPAVLTSSSGALVPSNTATVFVYERGTSTEVDVYAAASGGSPVSQPITCVQGRIEGWVEAPASLDLDITDGASNYVQAWEAVAASGITAAPAGWYDVTAYGATGDGVTNDYAAIQAAIDACGAGGGGIVYFPPGVYKCLSQLTIPDDNTGAWPTLLGNTRLCGPVSTESGRSANPGPVASATLDIRANTSPGMVYSRGVGKLEVDHLTFRNQSASTQPFIYTTGTCLQAHDNGFVGSSAKGGATCDQDAIVCGGTTITEDGSSDAPYQGYSSRILNNFFTRIRRAVYGRTYFNANLISGNWLQHDCGSNLAGGAPFELLGHPTNSCYGNVFLANQIEAVHYTYGFKSDYAIGNSYVANSSYDHGGSWAAMYRFEASAIRSMILHASGGGSVSEHASAAGTNVLLTSEQGVVSRLPALAFKVGATGATLSDNGTVAGKQRIYWDVALEIARLAVGNSAAASGPVGSLAAKVPLYDQGENLIGYVPVYSSIT